MLKKLIVTFLLFSIMMSTTARAAEIYIEIPDNEVNIYVPVDEPKTYYTSATVNIREKPTTESDSLGLIDFGYKFTGVDVGGWVYLEHFDGYIRSDYCVTELKSQSYPVNSVGFKSFMPYNTFSRSSSQYKLQTLAETDPYGLRKVGDRYCVAIGMYFNARVGQYIDIELSSGKKIKAVVADIKATQDTKGNDSIHSQNGCVSEFVVDKSKLVSKVRVSGDISDAHELWKSPVTRIIVYDKSVI